MKGIDYDFINPQEREEKKCRRGMPRLPRARKDAASCENVRGSASESRSARIRMGKPSMLKAWSAARAAGERGELKHLSTRRKRKKHRFP